MDTKTQKLMTIHRALHPRSCTDRLYLKRKDGGRGLLEIEECNDSEIRALSQYARESDDTWMTLVSGNLKALKCTETPDSFKKRRQQERREHWEQMPLAGQFLRQTT